MLMTHLQGRLRQHFKRKHPELDENENENENEKRRKRKKLLRAQGAQLLCRRLHPQSTKFDSDSSNENLKAQVKEMLLGNVCVI